MEPSLYPSQETWAVIKFFALYLLIVVVGFLAKLKAAGGAAAKAVAGFFFPEKEKTEPTGPRYVSRILILLVVGGLFYFLGMWWVKKTADFLYGENKPQAPSSPEFGGTLAAILIGSPIAWYIWGLRDKAKLDDQKHAEKQLSTETFARAMEMLGSVIQIKEGVLIPNREARVGAIQLLYQIARDVDSLRLGVLNIFVGYIRMNSIYWERTRVEKIPFGYWICGDIREAIHRLSEVKKLINENSLVPLNFFDLKGANLINISFNNMIIVNCDFQFCDLTMVEFKKCSIQSDFSFSMLVGTNFCDSIIDKSTFFNVRGLKWSSLSGVKGWEDAYFDKSFLSQPDFPGDEELREKMIILSEAKWTQMEKEGKFPEGAAYQ